MELPTNFLHALPIEIKNSIERWYRVSILLFIFCFSTMLCITATQLSFLRKHKNNYKTLKIRAPQEIIMQENRRSNDYSVKNSLSTKLVALCAQALPDDLHLLRYTLSANQIVLTGSGSSSERISAYAEAIQKKAPEVHSRLTSLKKAFRSVIFELKIELTNIQN